MDAVSQGINIKRNLQLEHGAHILYLFENQVSYLENVVSFTTDGVYMGNLVVVVDYVEIYHLVLERLSVQFSADELQRVFFIECHNFYGADTLFDSGSIIEHFEERVESLPHSDHAILTWARVVWKEQPDISIKIAKCELLADNSVRMLQTVSVCAYDGGEIDANLLVRLQRSHDYFMTDKEFVRSPLYASDKPVFPSLAVQSKMESELDLYKSKLDFAQVVSHEVRNPLTIIDGYAKMIRNRELNLSPESVDKLVSIGHYVAAIDQELSHIIETEQALSEDLYMHLESIDPSEIVPHVVEIMKVKSIVQNVNFKSSVALDSNHFLLGNTMGLRLILSNVISNAIKYSNERGTVEFHTGIRNNHIRFTIHDNGIGMSQKQLNSLYHKYAKLTESRSGQGLGLYIVKSLTDRFKGQINYDSELGRGTIVTIDFPLLDSK